MGACHMTFDEPIRPKTRPGQIFLSVMGLGLIGLLWGCVVDAGPAPYGGYASVGPVYGPEYPYYNEPYWNGWGGSYYGGFYGRGYGGTRLYRGGGHGGGGGGCGGYRQGSHDGGGRHGH